MTLYKAAYTRKLDVCSFPVKAKELNMRGYFMKKNRNPFNFDILNIWTLLYGLLGLSFIVIFLRETLGFWAKYISSSTAIYYMSILLLVKFYWFPGRNPEANNELGNLQDINSRIGVRMDASNPLYRSGMLRNSGRSFMRMSRLKGIYALQCQAIFQICILLLLTFSQKIVRKTETMLMIYETVEKILFLWAVVGILLLCIARALYNHLLNRERKQIYRPLVTMNFFEQQENEVELKKKSIKNLDIHNFSSMLYIELKRKYEYLPEIDATFTMSEGEAQISIFEDRYADQTLILMEVFSEQITECQINAMNERLQSCIQNGIKKKTLPILPACLIVVFYVDEMTETFLHFMERITNRSLNYSCLALGISIREQKMYIQEWMEGKENSALRKRLDDILHVYDYCMENY